MSWADEEVADIPVLQEGDTQIVEDERKEDGKGGRRRGKSHISEKLSMHSFSAPFSPPLCLCRIIFEKLQISACGTFQGSH